MGRSHTWPCQLWRRNRRALAKEYNCILRWEDKKIEHLPLSLQKGTLPADTWVYPVADLRKNCIVLSTSFIVIFHSSRRKFIEQHWLSPWGMPSASVCQPVVSFSLGLASLLKDSSASGQDLSQLVQANLSHLKYYKNKELNIGTQGLVLKRT